MVLSFDVAESQPERERAVLKETDVPKASSSKEEQMVCAISPERS
jgi:hypothetical protein